MKRALLLCGIGLAIVTLMVVAYVRLMPQLETENNASTELYSTSSAEKVSADGIVQKAGVSMYMEGTHRLLMADGSSILLVSSMVTLDSYVDAAVRVAGVIRSTVEAGGQMMEVENIEFLPEANAPQILREEPTNWPSSSSASSAAASSSAVQSSKPIAASSAAAIIRSSVAASVSPPIISSAAFVFLSSAWSSSSIAATADVSVKAMAKAKVDSSNFSSQYCTSHIGFCIPIHRNWYFQSFGANVSPYLWHVEVGDQAVEEPGDGVIMVNLASGPVTSSVEGIAEVQGDFVIAQKQWTGNRHFEITAAAELKAAVEFMANGLSVYETPAQ